MIQEQEVSRRGNRKGVGGGLLTSIKGSIMSESWINLLLTLFVVCSLILVSCTAGKFKEMSFQDVKTDYNISSAGKSNKDFIDAIDFWGAKSFGDWQKVKQTAYEERGVFIFRYRDQYSVGMGTECGILVSVEVKRESEGFLTVHFSNIRHHLSDCTWINEPGVQQLNVNFARTVETIHKTIGDFQ